MLPYKPLRPIHALYGRVSPQKFYSYITSSGPETDILTLAGVDQHYLLELLRPADIGLVYSPLGHILQSDAVRKLSTRLRNPLAALCTDISATANRHSNVYIKGSHSPHPLNTSSSNTTPPSSTITGSRAHKLPRRPKPYRTPPTPPVYTPKPEQ